MQFSRNRWLRSWSQLTTDRAIGSASLSPACAPRARTSPPSDMKLVVEKAQLLRAGFAIAKSPIVLIRSADLEYDPAEYEKLVRSILDGKADVVFGSRFRGPEAHRLLYFWLYIGNQFLTC